LPVPGLPASWPASFSPPPSVGQFHARSSVTPALRVPLELGDNSVCSTSSPTRGWNDYAVRLTAVRYALAEMTCVASVWAWIIDDTGFLKKGRHSVGVQRQYTGSAGKITNCQVGVSLTLATAQDHVPVDFELYVPDSWANDPERRAEARIPDHVGFQDQAPARSRHAPPAPYPWTRASCVAAVAECAGAQAVR